MRGAPIVSIVSLTLSTLAGCASVPHPPGGYIATAHGRAVHYDDHATDRDGTAIVLVHGAIADNRIWKYNIPGLSEHRRVIAVDLPGHGRSEIPTEYSMDVFADGIAAAMDHAGVERAVLVGQSNGVPTVRQFYRRYPERTAALIFVDGALKEVHSDEKLNSFLTGLQGDGYREVVRAHVRAVAGTSTLLTDEQRKFIEEIATAQPQDTAVGDIGTRTSPTIWGNDPIDVPALVVHSKAPTWDDEYRAYVDTLVTGQPYEFLQWGEVSHLLMMEKPEELNAAILEFVSAVDRAVSMSRSGVVGEDLRRSE